MRSKDHGGAGPVRLSGSARLGALAACVCLSLAGAGCRGAMEEVPGPVNMTPDVTPPVLLSGNVPEYTQEALEAKVEGNVAAECMITEVGAVTQCRIIQSLAPMDDAVLRALSTWRCNPARKDGEPVAVLHIFTLRLALPRAPGAAPPAGVITWHDGMTKPVLLSGPPVVYTKEALQNQVQGRFVAKCVITKEGTVTNCNVAQSLPTMDQVLLDDLMARKYKPVTYNGVPVTVLYTFTMDMRLKYPIRED